MLHGITSIQAVLKILAKTFKIVLIQDATIDALALSYEFDLGNRTGKAFFALLIVNR